MRRSSCRSGCQDLYHLDLPLYVLFTGSTLNNRWCLYCYIVCTDGHKHLVFYLSKNKNFFTTFLLKLLLKYITAFLINFMGIFVNL